LLKCIIQKNRNLFDFVKQILKLNLYKKKKEEKYGYLKMVQIQVKEQE
jgi:hypothetical protein